MTTHAKLRYQVLHSFMWAMANHIPKPNKAVKRLKHLCLSRLPRGTELDIVEELKGQAWDLMAEMPEYGGKRVSEVVLMDMLYWRNEEVFGPVMAELITQVVDTYLDDTSELLSAEVAEVYNKLIGKVIYDSQRMGD